MNTEFDLKNDNYLLFLFYEGNKNILGNLFQKYLEIALKNIKIILAKFYYIPLEINDFYFLVYETLENTVLKFCYKFKISFKNYFLKILRWNTFNYIKIFLSKKHQILNFSSSYQDNIKCWNPKSMNFNELNLKIITYHSNLLSNHEKKVMIKLLKNKFLTSQNEINAFYRVKNKIKLL